MQRRVVGDRHRLLGQPQRRRRLGVQHDLRRLQPDVVHPQRVTHQAQGQRALARPARSAVASDSTWRTAVRKLPSPTMPMGRGRGRRGCTCAAPGRTPRPGAKPGRVPGGTSAPPRTAGARATSGGAQPCGQRAPATAHQREQHQPATGSRRPPAPAGPRPTRRAAGRPPTRSGQAVAGETNRSGRTGLRRGVTVTRPPAPAPLRPRGTARAPAGRGPPAPRRAHRSAPASLSAKPSRTPRTPRKPLADKAVEGPSHPTRPGRRSRNRHSRAPV